MEPVFLYGLFMDIRLLESMGLSPSVIGKARLDDHRLVIGERATLVPEAGAVAYGLLISLTEPELERLYSGESVRDYQPSMVEVVRLDDEQRITATVYNLPTALGGGDRNDEYATKLAALVSGLGFPESYIRAIKTRAEPRC